MILDAPATGHALGLPAAPRNYGGIAPSGRIAAPAEELHDFLADPSRTGYVAAALAELMAVKEVLEPERVLVGGCRRRCCINARTALTRGRRSTA